MKKFPQIPQPKNPEKGFTLIELMIVIAIIAILVAIALPAYQNYIQKAKFSELVNAASGAKPAVTSHVQEFGAADDGTISGVDATNYDSGAAGNVLSVDVKADGTICVTAAAADKIGNPLAGKIVKMAPTAAGGTVTWECTSDADAKYLPSSCTNGAITGCGA